jgi:hypothetical protein
MIAKKLPAPSVRRRISADRRHALDVLSRSAHGCSEDLMRVQGVSAQTLARIIWAGFASTHVERRRAGNQWFEVVRIRITEKGRAALNGTGDRMAGEKAATAAPGLGIR